jgi:RNA 3'-terminal phosphate cyclase (ATP)
MLPMAIAGGGTFLTLPLSRHATTNAEVIGRFLPVSVSAVRDGSGTCRVEVGRS